MFDKGYQSYIKNSTIYFNRVDMDQYQFKINLLDLEPNFNLPENVVRYLIGYYELSFQEQISILEKIDRREKRIGHILRKPHDQ